MASPAECVRAIFLKEEVVVFPTDFLQLQPDSLQVPCYVNQLPDTDGTIVALHDKQGSSFGRLMTGKYTSHPGVKLTVRSLNSTRAYDTIRCLATLLEQITGRRSVPIRGTENFIASIYQTGDLISLGEETGTRRSIWIMNLQVAMEDTATLPSE